MAIEDSELDKTSRRSQFEARDTLIVPKSSCSGFDNMHTSSHSR